MHVLCSSPPQCLPPGTSCARSKKYGSRCSVSKLLLYLFIGGPRGRPTTNPDPAGVGGPDSHRTARLDVPALGATIQRLLQAGLAPSTQRTYLAGKKYLLFCQKTSTQPLPATEHKLLQFIAFVADQGLRHQTMKYYLSAIRHLQIECRGGRPKGGQYAPSRFSLTGDKTGAGRPGEVHPVANHTRGVREA